MLYLSIAMLVLLFFSAMPMYHASEGMQDLSKSPITQPQPAVYINGDWNITDTQVIENQTIILTGNLTVESGGNLTFRNVTLMLNCSTLYQYRIDIKSGAYMYIFDLDNDNTTTEDASNITVTDPNNRAGVMKAWDGSVFRMRNSRVSGFGYGVYLNTDDAIVDRCYITDCLYGIRLNNSDATISNNTITWNNMSGIMATHWSNGTIVDNWISNIETYGIWADSDGNSPAYPSSPKIIRNVIRDIGPGGGGVGIEIVGSKPTIRDTIILRSSEDGLYSLSSTPTLINVTIDAQNKGNYGIASSATGYIYIIKSTIINAKVQDFSIAGAPGSFFVVTNSTFNKVWIDSSGNLTVRWYLNVYVEDSNHQPIPAADVRIKDNENGTYDKNFSTDLNGYVKWIVVTEYWRNNDTIIYYTPYNISVNYSGLNFSNNPRDTNMNTSKRLWDKIPLYSFRIIT